MKSGPVSTRQESARTSVYFLLLHSSTFLSFKRRKKPKLAVWDIDMPVNQLLSKADMKLPAHSPHRPGRPGAAPDSPAQPLRCHRDHRGGTTAGNHQTKCSRIKALPPIATLCLLFSSQPTIHSLTTLNRSQGEMPWWTLETCLAPGCWKQEDTCLLPWGEREILSWPLIWLPASLGARQSDRLAKHLPCPYLCNPQPFLKAWSSTALCHPFPHLL